MDRYIYLFRYVYMYVYLSIGLTRREVLSQQGAKVRASGAYHQRTGRTKNESMNKYTRTHAHAHTHI